MNRSRSLFVSLALAALTLASTALADFSYTTTFRFTGKTTLKAVEPEGLKVKVTIGDQVKEDTIPVVFQLPDGDAFVPVTITARDGSTWTQKIEVKDKQQTELKVQYTPKEASKPAATAAAHKFIGTVTNITAKCAEKERGELRFELMRDGAKAYEYVVPKGQRLMNVEVQQGSYSVRVFRRGPRDSGFIFVTTAALEVTKDGWDFSYGCR